MKRRCLLLTLASLPLGASRAWAQVVLPANTLEVKVQRVPDSEPSAYEVQATALVRATPQEVWQVLTDYERMHEFVPDMASCKVLSREASAPNAITLEQHGSMHFLFFSQAIDLVVRVVEQPISTIDITLVSGNMKAYSSHWEIRPVLGNKMTGTQISYQGKLTPDFYVPRLFGVSLMRSNIQNMFEAVMVEIEKSIQVKPALKAAPPP
ncbi:MAG: SRPBCC family protein [Pseudomonadota bacterium]